MAFLAARAKLWSTPMEVLEAALDLLGITEADLLCDLGCGDGPALFAAAHRGAKALGVEILADRAAATAEKVKEAGLEEKITVVAGNALDADLSKVTCCFLYLIERGLKTVFPMLQAAGSALDPEERKRPLRVVTCQYRIKDCGVEPVTVKRVYLKDKPDVMYLLHLYHIPRIEMKEIDAKTTEAGGAASSSSIEATGTK
jgi:SAM-dependent methyltransferase